jgi:hypothetical protein
MTVAELIKDLQQYPGDAQVVVERPCSVMEDDMEWFEFDQTWIHKKDETQAEDVVALQINEKPSYTFECGEPTTEIKF